MPYISKEDRQNYEELENMMDQTIIHTKGDLEYLIFMLMKRYMSTRDYRYTELHNCVYATMHCADEFRRRFLDKREDEAREKNGDI